jgi:hypothetical protein
MHELTVAELRQHKLSCMRKAEKLLRAGRIGVLKPQENKCSFVSGLSRRHITLSMK